MKKSLFIVAAAAMMTACTSEVLREDYRQADAIDEAISFETFVQKAVNTRASSENNGMSTTSGLENFHESFMVWGYKYNSAKTASEDAVFTKKEVNAVMASGSATSWTYTPVAYWDKSADYYDFYAAAPADNKWGFNNYKFSYADFTVTGQTLASSDAADAQASFTGLDNDLMISNDVKNYKTYSSNVAVNFDFNHILSRLNISVETANLASGDVCKLKKLYVFNMKNKGSFDESKTEYLNASGDYRRWTTASGDGVDVISDGVGFDCASGDVLTEEPVYYYRALCIPQEVKHIASGDCATECPLNGNGLDANDKPYINIQYSINDDNYSYFYNLANIFCGNDADNLKDIQFNEGWMNTLHIIISPAIIKFDADAFNWNEKDYGDVTIPE